VTTNLRCLAAAALLLLSAACGTTAQSRFFALTALEVESSPADAGALELVEPVRVADYLQRPQLVRRRSALELDVDEYSRWAEPLDLALTRVLGQDLRVLLGPQATARTRVACSVTRFEQDVEGSAVVEATFVLRDVEGDAAPRTRSWIGRAPLAGDDSAALAEALDGLVHELARAIASELGGAGS
jgi:uncharacterized lipoprotein YmbA